MAKEPKKLIANNKKVYHDYFLLEKYEAGISLAGTEVKSLRMGKGSIKESFIRIENGEIILYGMHITPYEKGNIFNKDPLRPKKLLLHKKEIEKLSSKMKEKGFTTVTITVSKGPEEINYSYKFSKSYAAPEGAVSATYTLTGSDGTTYASGTSDVDGSLTIGASDMA